jgi:uncharacterized protein DUF6916
MAVSRRRFLRQTALATAACFALPLEAWSQVNRLPAKETAPKEVAVPAPGSSKINGEADALKHLMRPDFESVVGSGFKVGQTVNDPNPQWLRLLKVTDLPTPPQVNLGSMAVQPKQTTSTQASSGFMLSFLGGAATPLTQGTYVFQHEGLGRFGLFIVPTAPGQQSYTAVINRLIQLTPVQPGGGPNSPVANPPSGPMVSTQPIQPPAAPMSVSNNGGALQQDMQDSPERPVRTRMPE